MAQIGYGYGSEYQLMRFLGHHRNLLEKEIRKQVGLCDGEFNWLDFGFADPAKVISGDKEIVGLKFLKERFQSKYPDVEREYKKYNIKNQRPWQSWDAVFIYDDILYLVEAKAHIGEFESKGYEKGKNKDSNVRRYFEDQLGKFNIKVSDSWFGKYYQFCNRLATAALLNNCGITTKILYICFERGYRKRIVAKDEIKGEYSIIEVCDRGGQKDDFENTIADEMRELNIKDDSSISNLFAGRVYINSEPEL